MTPHTCRHACATACTLGARFSPPNLLRDLHFRRAAGRAKGTRAITCCRLGPCTGGGGACPAPARHAWQEVRP